MATRNRVGRKYCTTKPTNAASLERVADIIESAEFVQVFGVGTSSIVALDLHHKPAHIGIRCDFRE